MREKERKPLRLSSFDYNENGAYFVTVCTKDRKPILCEIVGDTPQPTNSSVGDGVLDVPPKLQMLKTGIIAEKYIRQIPMFYEDISVTKYVIMPNHIHFLLVVDRGTSRTPSPTKQNSTVSRFVSTFKRFCNKEIGENIWQRSFNDHVIRNQADYDEHWQYIDENPLRWHLDELFAL